MNKFLTFVLLFVILFSCKTKSPSVSGTSKLDRKAQSGIKGNWQITNVSFEGSDFFKVTSFEIADSKCFIGSTWNFIPNNNEGTMSLNSTGCPSFSSPIVWTINKEGTFVLKVVEAGLKSKKITQGYLLKFANQTETSFQLIDAINIGGQNKDVVYQFEKMN